MNASNKKQLAFLLIIALGVIYLQVIIGGITRLTESGLSMTDWKVVAGTMPPTTDAAWQAEFELYQQSPQYQQINKGMTLEDFKSIFFWEWLHRVWGRWGFVFMLGIFAFMYFRKKLDTTNTKRFYPFLLLYILQGVLGWFMVKSGLVDVPRVSHYRLAAHLITAIALFAYVVWWVSDLLIPKIQYVVAPKLRRFAWGLVVLTLVQIVFGAFMSGLRAATHYPTFPDMNGEIIPSNLFPGSPLWINFFESIPTIQFTHRGIAYLLAILIVVFWSKSKRISKQFSIFKTTVNVLLLVLAVQFILGISVLLLSKSGTIPIFWGVAHQAVGLLLLSTLLLTGFQLRKTA